MTTTKSNLEITVSEKLADSKIESSVLSRPLLLVFGIVSSSYFESELHIVQYRLKNRVMIPRKYKCQVGNSMSRVIGLNVSRDRISE